MFFFKKIKARKTIWTELGFGDFYNELAVWNKFRIFKLKKIDENFGYLCKA